MIGQFSHDGNGWETRVNNQSLVALVGFDPSIVSQIGRVLVRALLNRLVRSPLVGFVSVMYKSFVRRQCRFPFRK